MVNTSFFSEMLQTIADRGRSLITRERREPSHEQYAGLVELCAAAAPAWIPPWVVAWRHLWPWQIWDPLARRLEPLVRPILERVIGEGRFTR